MSLVDDTSEPTDNPRDRRHRHLEQRAFLTQAACCELEASSGDYDCERVGVALHFIHDWLGREYGEAIVNSHDPYHHGLHELDADAADAGLLAEVRAGAHVLRDAQLLQWADLADYDNDLAHIAVSLQDYFTLRGLRPRSI
jgi:hypothetical protein